MAFTYPSFFRSLFFGTSKNTLVPKMTQKQLSCSSVCPICAPIVAIYCSLFYAPLVLTSQRLKRISACSNKEPYHVSSHSQLKMLLGQQIRVSVYRHIAKLTKDLSIVHG